MNDESPNINNTHDQNGNNNVQKPMNNELQKDEKQELGQKEIENNNAQKSMNDELQNDEKQELGQKEVENIRPTPPIKALSIGTVSDGGASIVPVKENHTETMTDIVPTEPTDPAIPVPGVPVPVSQSMSGIIVTAPPDEAPVKNNGKDEKGNCEQKQNDENDNCNPLDSRISDGPSPQIIIKKTQNMETKSLGRSDNSSKKSSQASSTSSSSSGSCSSSSSYTSGSSSSSSSSKISKVSNVKKTIPLNIPLRMQNAKMGSSILIVPGSGEERPGKRMASINIDENEIRDYHVNKEEYTENSSSEDEVDLCKTKSGKMAPMDRMSSIFETAKRASTHVAKALAQAIPGNKTHTGTVSDLEDSYREMGLGIYPIYMLLKLTFPYLLIVILNGILFGFSSTYFHYAIHELSHFYRDTVGDMAKEIMPEWWFPCFHMAFSVIASGLLVGAIVWKFIPECAEGGTSAVKICLAFGAEVPIYVGVARFILTTIYIGFGNPLGSEAPTLHICAVVASSVYSNINRFFGEDHFPHKNHEALVVVGCACGMSAAFNTPLGGIIYALEEFGEEATSGVSTRMLSVWVATGSVVALVVHRLIKGNKQYFESNLDHAIEFELETWMLICIPIAALCAVLSYMYSRLILYLRGKRFEHCTPTLSMGCGSAIVALVAAIFYVIDIALFDDEPNYYWGVGEEMLKKLMAGGYPPGKCLLFFVGKFLTCAIAFSFGGAGGLFTPSLIMGGTLGVLISALGNDQIAPGVSSEVCCVLCMAGFFSGLLHLPLTAAIVSVEMVTQMSTRTNLILPILITSVLSYYFGNILSEHNIFEMILLMSGMTDELLDDEEGRMNMMTDPNMADQIPGLASAFRPSIAHGSLGLGAFAFDDDDLLKRDRNSCDQRSAARKSCRRQSDRGSIWQVEMGNASVGSFGARPSILPQRNGSKIGSERTSAEGNSTLQTTPLKKARASRHQMMNAFRG